MSALPWVPLYVNDFLSDVGHLGNTELGVYTRLLLVYYRDARPLPVDTDRLRRLAMTYSPEECRALDAVVSEFFKFSAEPDGRRVWRHTRADKIIAEATAKHATASAKATAAAAARWAKNAPSIASGNAYAMPTTTTTTTTSPSLRAGVEGAAVAPPHAAPQERPEAKKRGRKSSAALGIDALLALGVSQQSAQDWMTARQAKRAPLTQSVLDATQVEASKVGLTLVEAITHAAGQGWAGFRASYMHPKDPSSRPKEAWQDRRDAVAASAKATQDAVEAMRADPEAVAREIEEYTRQCVDAGLWRTP